VYFAAAVDHGQASAHAFDATGVRPHESHRRRQ
jgi:hypothetical protein